MGKPLFEVSSHHTDRCGEPPCINGDAPGKYFGYFVNEHGEQTVYTYDHETGEATLRAGDAGWNAEYPVVDGAVPGLLLTEAERTWLLACWLATGAIEQRTRPVTTVSGSSPRM